MIGVKGQNNCTIFEVQFLLIKLIPSPLGPHFHSISRYNIINKHQFNMDLLTSLKHSKSLKDQSIIVVYELKSRTIFVVQLLLIELIQSPLDPHHPNISRYNIINKTSSLLIYSSVPNTQRSQAYEVRRAVQFLQVQLLLIELTPSPSQGYKERRVVQYLQYNFS